MEPICRSEVKYELPRRGLRVLRADLAALLASDPNSGPEGYAVRSLYFESHGFHALRAKLDGVFDRFKLRVRGYPPLDADSPLVLEIKRKQGAAIIKDRTTIGAEDVELLTRGQHGALLARHPDDRVLRRFVAAKASLGGAAVPLLIDYRRHAFAHPSPDVYIRATIDEGFSAAIEKDFFRAAPLPHPFGSTRAILEIKTPGPRPQWLPMLVEKHALSPSSLSKFALASARTHARSPGLL